MWPARSAYTRLCAGASNAAAAARNEAQSVAVSSARIASAVVVGRSAVHSSATAYPPPGTPGGSCPASATRSSTSESSGPWAVERTVIVTSSPPCTWIVSVRVRSGRQAPS